MKKTKIITLTLLLATLVAGCAKEQMEPAAITNNQAQGRLWIFANDFGGDSKVSLNPADPSEAANWINGERVMLNGTVYQIGQDEQLKYCLKTLGGEYVEPLGVTMRSLYPGASFDGNEIEIKNGKEIVLHSLKIKFLSGGKQSMAFPMVANAADATATALYFNHLSGGVQVTLQNNTGAAVNVAKLRIVAQSTTDVVNLGINDTIARWAVEGPWVPFNMVGQNGNEVDVKYSSVMYFDLEDEANGTNYKTIAPGNNLVFCVPITISSMRKLNVTGYAADGTQLFQVHKTFQGETEVQVERNRMYDFPVIPIN